MLLFLDREASGKERAHFKRNAWLLIFGLVNGYLFLWPGDILLTHALAGFVLFFFRNLSTKALVRWSVSLFLLLTLYNGLLYGGLHLLRSAHVETEARLQKVRNPAPSKVRWRASGKSFEADYQPESESLAEEIIARGNPTALLLAGTSDHNTGRNRRDSARIFAPRRLCHDADWHGAISFVEHCRAAVSSGFIEIWPSADSPLGLLINAYERSVPH